MLATSLKEWVRVAPSQKPSSPLPAAWQQNCQIFRVNVLVFGLRG
jgi:hypothetical protein